MERLHCRAKEDFCQIFRTVFFNSSSVANDATDDDDDDATD